MGRFKDEGNILVSNQSKNVLVNYNFMLRVEGIYDLPCKAVHSFTKENEFEYVQEGGLNDYVHMLRKPVTKPFSFTVERYVGMDIIPPLPLGAELMLPVILMVAPNANQFGNAKRTFVFTGCTVMSKTFGELNAEKSELLTETIVIGYREMTEITVPVHAGSDGKLWEFDGTKVDGNSKKSAKSLSDNGSAKLRQWLVSGEDGTRTKSAAKSPGKGEAKLRQWLVTKEDGTKTKSAAKSPGKGEAGLRQWLVTGEEGKEGEGSKSVQSAKKYSDIFKQENNQKDTDTREETKPRIKQSPDTGEADLRQWLVTEEGGSKKQSAKKYSDIFKQENNQKDTDTPEENKPRVKQSPDTGEADLRQWLVTGEDGTKTQSAAKAPNTGEAEVRKWPPTKSSKTIADIITEKNQE